MSLKNYALMALAALVLLFTGCSKDTIEEYNKPAMYWYTKIVEQVSNGDLEKADAYSSSLQGEHIGSPLLPEATMILALAHMQHEEYLLSEHFLDEYIKRYATPNEKEDAEFLKIKAKYKALPHPRRDQVLIDEAIAQGELFKQTYANSMYYEVVNTMLVRLYLARYVLNEEITDLYERVDKPKSAQFYRELHPQPWIVENELDRAEAPWYRAWFEGDGTQSWYGFIIPDTQSVVSRNSIKEEDANATQSLIEQPKEVKQPEPTQQKEDDNTSWYDFMNPFAETEKEEDVTPKEEASQTSSWYDFMNPFADAKESEVKELEVKEESSSWYDFLNPFSKTDAKEGAK